MGSRKGSVDNHLRYDVGVKVAYMKYRTIEDCLNCGKTKCNGCPSKEKEYLQKYMNKDDAKGVGSVFNKN